MNPEQTVYSLVLLKKNHGPEILLGKWNGPGGVVEARESTHDASTREMGEETGIWVQPDAWRIFYTLVGPGYSVSFLTALTKAAVCAIAMEEEEVRVWKVSDVIDPQKAHEFPANIPWLTLLALDETTLNSCGTSTN